MRITKSIKAISVMMSLAMLLTVIPTGVFALNGGEVPTEVIPETEEPAQDTAVDTEEIPEERAAYVLGEMPERRESNSKQFRMSDGSYTTVSYTSDVHYAEGGEWKEIDNTLLPKDNGIVNRASDVKYTFNSEPDTLPGVTATLGDYQISFSGVQKILTPTAAETDEILPAADTAKTETDDETANAAPDTALAENSTESAPENVEYALPSFDMEIMNPHMEAEADAKETDNEYQTLGEAAILSTVTSAVRYNETSGGDSYVYELQGRNLKESVVVGAPREDYTYFFDLNLAGLAAVLTESGDISLRDGANEIFTMPAPYMLDADGTYSDAAAYALSELPEGGYALTLTADADWINAPERKFPVVIDPSVFVTNPGSNGTKITAECIYVGTDNVSHDYNDTYFAVGREENIDLYSYIKVNTLPAIPYNARFCKAWIGMQGVEYYALSGTSFSAFDLYAQEALGNWKTQFTGATNTNQIVDYVTIKPGALSSLVQFEVTRQAEKWYSDSSENKGIVLYAEKTNGQSLDNNSLVEMHFPRYQSNSGKVSMPYFAVNYRNIQGLESYYSYQDFSARRAGEAYVSTYTGALTLVHTDVSDGYTLSHVYNSNYANSIFSSSATDSGGNPIFHTVNYDSMVIGKGWKLSAQESVVTQSFTNFDGTQGEYAIYTDGDGTEHYFHKTGTNEFKDEDGLGLTLVRNTSAHSFTTMTDDKGNEKLFIYGYLTRIKDSNGNITAFVYNNKTFSASGTAWYPASSGNKLTKIVQKNDGKTVYTVAALGYTGNRLTSITDRYGKVTSCAPNSTSYQVNAITEPDGTSLRYYYGGGDLRMSEAYDSDGKTGLLFGYLENKTCINKVTSYGADSAGTLVSDRIYYFNLTVKGYTKVRDCGKDKNTATKDDVVGHYVLDNYGRTVSYAAIDQSANTLSSFGGTYQPHETGKETSKKNNRMLSEGSSGVVAQNKLLNGDGESASSWHPGTVIGDYSTGRNTNAKKSGNSSISVNLVQSTKSASAYQDVTFTTGGYYNVSAYVKSTNLKTDDTNSLSGAYLDVTGTGVEIVRRDILREVTDTQVNGGWRMLSTIVHLSGPGSYTCHLKLNNCTGTVYFDEIRLTDGRDVSAFNLIENGNFDHGLADAGETEGASIVNMFSYNGIYSDALELKGEPQKESLYSKSVNINMTAAEAQNTTFLLSGWVYARSLPITQDDRTFQLSAQIHYDGGDSQYVSARYNADIVSEWQYVCTPVVPNKNKAVTGITVYCSFKKNSGYAYFDDIALTMEPCATYRYNDDGKLVSVNSSNRDEMQYQYSGANLISASGGAGGNYSYTYDSAHNITKATNEGLSQTMTYDAAGLMTSTTLKGSTAPYLKTSATYIGDGSKVSTVTDTLGNTSSYQYSTGGSLTSVTAPVSDTINTGTLTTNAQTDDAGRPWKTYINNVASVEYTYTDGNLGSVSRGGYINGNSTKQTQEYSFTYDLFGRCLDTKVGNRTLITNTYDIRNSSDNDDYVYMETADYGNGYSVDYKYDELERVIEKDDSYWNEKYAYDKNGKISWQKATSYTGQDGRTTTYEYDTLGRLIYSLEINTSGKTLRYVKNKYNNKNQLTSCTLYNGGKIQTQSYTYKSDGSIDTFDVTNGDKITNTYDSLKRMSKKTVDHDSTGDTYRITVETEYVNRGESDQTTGLVGSVRYGYKNNDNSFDSGSKVRDYKYMYEYDNVGNITRAYYRTAGSDNKYSDHDVGRYAYDEQNRLIMEQVYDEGYTLLYIYDTYGNIREVKKYKGIGFTSFGEVTAYGTLIGTESYGYTDGTWKDLLTSYKGHTFTYDEIGNPKKYYSNRTGSELSLGWNGRELTSVLNADTWYLYNYDPSGQRISKTVGNQKYTYLYYGTKLMQYSKNGEYTLNFFYDDSDEPLGFYFDSFETASLNSGLGKKYYYVRNAQGDVVQIRDSQNQTIANYHYDAWGKLLSITDANGNSQSITNETFSFDNTSIACINPIRYRGYIYDNETGFYYLNSRYYDPSLRRFLNADDTDVLIATPDGLTDKNLYAYCDNNPVMREDDGGEFWKELKYLGEKLVEAAVATVAVVGAITAVGGAIAITVGTGGVGALAIPAAISLVADGALTAAAVTAAAGVTAVAVGEVGETAIEFSKNSNDSNSYDPDPYKRPGQKKQNREVKEKKRKKDWRPNPNKRQMPPKKHTPGRDHRKYR